jgi:hypothetical protein
MKTKHKLHKLYTTPATDTNDLDEAQQRMSREIMRLVLKAQGNAFVMRGAKPK